MSIRFYCPLGHRLRVPDSRAGKKGRCPICQQRVIVPVADPQPSGRSKRPPRSPIVGEPGELESILESELGLAPPDSPPPPPRTPEADPPLAPPSRHPPLPPAAGPSGTLFSALHEPSRSSHGLASRSSSHFDPGLDPHVAGYRTTAYVLAGCVAGASLASAFPALRCYGAGQFPLWMPIVALVCTASLVYALWLASLPDWSTERVGVAACAAVALLYAAAMALVLTTPRGQTLPFDLQPWRNFAGGWSGANVLVYGFAAYGLHGASDQWRHRRRAGLRG